MLTDPLGHHTCISQQLLTLLLRSEECCFFLPINVMAVQRNDAGVLFNGRLPALVQCLTSVYVSCRQGNMCYKYTTLQTYWPV